MCNAVDPVDAYRAYLSELFVHNSHDLQLRHMSQQSVEVWKVLKEWTDI